jgi:hypothetical protein
MLSYMDHVRDLPDGVCTVCDGTGKTRNCLKDFQFNEENVRNFAQFCAESGGFIIP